jgi:hypothetical protein
VACGCKEKTPEQKLSEAELMQAKRVVRWAAWFVSLDEPLRLLRFCSEEDSLADLPEDGFLMARTRFADGTGENIGGNGWIVAMETRAGLILQATGDNARPDPARYLGAKFIKDKLAPSALLHVAAQESQAWR